MMTPPFSICARPALRASEEVVATGAVEVVVLPLGGWLEPRSPETSFVILTVEDECAGIEKRDTDLARIDALRGNRSFGEGEAIGDSKY
jgi:hypothetical protein